MNSSKELSFNNVVRDGSSGSDKSDDSEQVNGGLSKDECEYLKSLSEDKKRENELINLVNLLKQRNEELEHQMKKSEMIYINFI
ncbi:hypothetical protein RB653_004037 [Dictyostelium firmibasis]|uniref:Uncharacterized protein n=1 Tax=Dictyostelium firmibasis TaxID=79012 RepID=A0AAN7U074_9MYCE